MNLKQKSVLLLAPLLVTGAAYATDAAPTKTYTLTNLQRVVSNHPNCTPLYHALQQLAKKPLSLQFASQSEPANFAATDTTGTLKNHSYTIVKQDVKDNVVNRVGMGSFEIDNSKVNYIIEISADAGQKNYKYLYPVIFSSKNGHCYYTALVQPDANTVAAFKKNIEAGVVAKSTDLSSG
jgi:hypothetical protein